MSGYAKEKEKIAALSVISNTVLVLLKLVAGLYTGSVSIISEAVHSGMDLLASVIALVAVRAANRPPDATHAFGHGKIENISGAVEAVLIIGAAIAILYEAAQKLLYAAPLEHLSWGAGIMAVSAAVNGYVSRRLLEVGRATDSMALIADAMHLRTDVYTSVGVLVGLGFIAVTGNPVFDPLLAIVVALLIFKAGSDIAVQCLRVLLDARLPDEEEARIAAVLEQHRSSFRGYHQLRTRKAGPERHVDLHLVVPRNLCVEEAHQICDHLEQAINRELPNTTTIIHVEPCQEKCAQCRVQVCRAVVRRACQNET